jgi:hypothetical protein
MKKLFLLFLFFFFSVPRAFASTTYHYNDFTVVSYNPSTMVFSISGGSFSAPCVSVQFYYGSSDPTGTNSWAGFSAWSNGNDGPNCQSSTIYGGTSLVFQSFSLPNFGYLSLTSGAFPTYHEYVSNPINFGVLEGGENMTPYAVDSTTSATFTNFASSMVSVMFTAIKDALPIAAPWVLTLMAGFFIIAIVRHFMGR